MNDPEWAGGQGVEYIREDADVLEVQIGGVVEVDVGLPNPIEQKQPASRPIGVRKQLRSTRANVDAAPPVP